MLMDQSSTMMASWNVLQRPIHRGQGINDSFWALLAAIDQGWYVGESVLKIHGSRAGEWMYLFILAHHNYKQFCQIILPESADVDLLINRNGYLVETGNRG